MSGRSRSSRAFGSARASAARTASRSGSWSAARAAASNLARPSTRLRLLRRRTATQSSSVAESARAVAAGRRRTRAATWDGSSISASMAAERKVSAYAESVALIWPSVLASRMSASAATSTWSRSAAASPVSTSRGGHSKKNLLPRRLRCGALPPEPTATAPGRRRDRPPDSEELWPRFAAARPGRPCVLAHRVPCHTPATYDHQRQYRGRERHRNAAALALLGGAGLGAARSTTASRSRCWTPAKCAETEFATAPARGRSSRSPPKQCRARPINSGSPAQASSRLSASAVSPRAALR